METKTISKKKLIGLLLAFIMTAGTLIATAVLVSAVGLTEIDEVEVALHYPELGYAHCTVDGVHASVVPLDQGHYTVEKSYWFNGGTMETNDGCGLAPGSFVAGKPYFAQFELVPESGYIFSENLQVTINGAEVRIVNVRNEGAKVEVATEDIIATQNFETKGSDSFPVRVVISTFDKEGHNVSEVGGTAFPDKPVVKYGDRIYVDVSPYYGYGIKDIDFGSGATGGFQHGTERSATIPADFGQGNAGGYFQIDVTFQETETENLTLVKSFDWNTMKWMLKWNAIAGADRYEIRICRMSEDDEFQTVATVEWDGTMEYSYGYANSDLAPLYEYEVRVVAVQDKAFEQVDELAVSNDVFIYKMGRIRFDLNGGDSGKPNDVTGKAGNIVVIPSTIPTRIGYDFKCWEMQMIPTPVSFIPGSVFTLFGDTLLYAVWEDNGVGPKITKQPADATVELGETVSFSVTATGTAPLKYQWQSRQGATGTWSNSGLPDAKTDTITFTATTGLHGWQFRCVVTDGNGNPKTSEPATLKVKAKIKTQPKDATAIVGSTVKFTVSANGKAPLNYQWQSRKDSSSAWSNSGLPGAKTVTLTVTALAGLHGWQFRCIVTDGNGLPAESKPATLTVKPAITKQPANTSAEVGDTAQFTVTANGKAPLKYQWQSRKDSSSAWSNSGQPGAKTATLNVTALAGLHGWQFRCIVTDANGQSAESNPATLTVRPKITTQPKNATATVGSIAKFTVSANGKATLKYQWQSRKDSSSAWSNSGLPGAKTATLNVTALAGLHGWQFRCIVTDANGQSTESKPATLTVKPVITKQPANVSVNAGATARFTVTANGKAPLKYQWQSRKDSSSAWSNSGLPGAKTATLSVTAVKGLNGWQFRCIVTDANGQPVESNPATLTVK